MPDSTIGHAELHVALASVARAIAESLEVTEVWDRVASACRTIAPLQANTLRHRQLSSVAFLSDEDRYLRATSTLPIAVGVTYHSIIGSNDEVVPYSSSHLDGAASEQLVPAGHSVQQTPAAILAIRTILRDQVLVDDE